MVINENGHLGRDGPFNKYGWLWVKGCQGYRTMFWFGLLHSLGLFKSGLGTTIELHPLGHGYKSHGFTRPHFLVLKSLNSSITPLGLG